METAGYQICILFNEQMVIVSAIVIHKLFERNEGIIIIYMYTINDWFKMCDQVCGFLFLQNATKFKYTTNISIIRIY